MEDMISFIRQNVEGSPGDRAFVSGKNTAYKIDKNKYYPVTAWVSSKPVAFIDGGSSLFIESPSLCVGFVRAVGVVMQKKRTTHILTDEFFFISTAHNENGRIFYRTRYFPTNKTKELIPELKFDSCDPALSTGQEAFPLSKMIDAGRRFLELNLARQAIDVVGRDGIIVLDGNLRAYFPGEGQLLDSLYSKAKENNTLVTAVSKTSTLLTTKGDTLNAALIKNSPLNQWYYYPAYTSGDESHRAEIYFAKLHKRSRHVFTVDIQKEQAGSADISKVLGFFAYYSMDAAFPGYLYGLIKADSLARVSNRETEVLLTKFSALDPKLFELIRPYINSLDAHNVLDNLG